MRTRKAQWLFMVLGAGLFLWVLARLFLMRFEAGDMYPPYSSLRADPLGAMALFEAIDRLPGVAAGRQLRPVSKIKRPGETTLFMLHGDIVDYHYYPDALGRDLGAFVLQGGRLVVAFAPILEVESRVRDRLERRRKWYVRQEEKQKKKDGETDEDAETSGTLCGDGQCPLKKSAAEAEDKEAGKEDKGGKKEAEDGDAREEREDGAPPLCMSCGPGWRPMSLLERWGVTDIYAPIPVERPPGELRMKVGQVEARRTSQTALTALPESLAWRTSLAFKPENDAWRILYARGEGEKIFPVVIERPYGLGEIALVSDEYYFSNEAMREDRRPALMAWMIGSRPVALFDEWHRGVSENPGVMTLARRYRLHGALLAALVLAGLFVWRSASSLVPPYESAPRENVDLGHDSAEGLVSLLRNHAPRDRLLRLCLEEWKRTANLARPSVREKAERLEREVERYEALPPRQRDLVAGWKRMNDIINQKEK